jgi:hypothetical protein
MRGCRRTTATTRFEAIIKTTIRESAVRFCGLQGRFVRVLVIAAALLAVAVAMRIGCGAERTGQEQLRESILRDHAKYVAAYGRNVLAITPGGETHSWGDPVRRSLTVEDANVIEKRCPSVAAVAPVVVARAKVTAERKEWIPAFVFGTTPHYLVVRDWTDMSDGHGFSDADVREAVACCLLGKTVAVALFGRESPVGRSVQIKGRSFGVVGLLSEKGRGFMGADEDDIILLPWTAAAKLLDTKDQGLAAFIWAKAVSTEKMPVAIREIRNALREARALETSAPDDFTVVDYVWSKEEVPVQTLQVEGRSNRGIKSKSGEYQFPREGDENQ